MVEYVIDNNIEYTSNQDNGKFVTAVFTPISISEFSHFGEISQQEPIDTYQNALNFATEALSNENLKNYITGEDWQNDETDDVGDYVQDFDFNAWSPSITSNNYITEQTLSKPNFNVDIAALYLLNNAHKKSTHKCAAYVRRGLLAGGINMDDRPKRAGLYLEYFRRKPQWTEINPSEVQKGDVCVTVNSGDGHIAMWTGNNWVSDFILRGPHVYSYSADGKNTFYFRYTG